MTSKFGVTRPRLTRQTTKRTERSTSEQRFFEGGDDNNCILHAVNNACGQVIMRWEDSAWMEKTFDTPLEGIYSDDQEQRQGQRERKGRVDLTYGLYEVQSVFNKMEDRPFNIANVRTAVDEKPLDDGERFRTLALEQGITTLFYAGSLMEGVGHSIVVKYDGTRWWVYDSLRELPILLSAYTEYPHVMSAHFSVRCALVPVDEGTFVDVGYVHDSTGTAEHPLTIAS